MKNTKQHLYGPGLCCDNCGGITHTLYLKLIDGCPVSLDNGIIFGYVCGECNTAQKTYITETRGTLMLNYRIPNFNAYIFFDKLKLIFIF